MRMPKNSLFRRVKLSTLSDCCRVVPLNAPLCHRLSYTNLQISASSSDASIVEIKSAQPTQQAYAERIENDQAMGSGTNGVAHVVCESTDIEEVANLVGVSEQDGRSNNDTELQGRARLPEHEANGSGTDFQEPDAPQRRPFDDDDGDNLPLRAPPDGDDDNAQDLNVDVTSLDVGFQNAISEDEGINSPQDDVLPARQGRDSRTSGDDTNGTFMPQPSSVSEVEFQVIGGAQHHLPQKLCGNRCRARLRQSEQIARKKRLQRLKPLAGRQVSLPTRRKNI